MRESFRSLGRRMLREGIAPCYVHRTLTELRDHEADLIDEAISVGLCEQDARDEARNRLGDNALLLSQAVDHGELKCRFRYLAWLAYRFRAVMQGDRVLVDPLPHGPEIARWTLSACLSGLATLTMLFGLQLAVSVV